MARQVESRLYDLQALAVLIGDDVRKEEKLPKEVTYELTQDGVVAHLSYERPSWYERFIKGGNE